MVSVFTSVFELIDIPELLQCLLAGNCIQASARNKTIASFDAAFSRGLEFLGSD
jgi:hypothetical protein